jgi:hypothetical protein
VFRGRRRTGTADGRSWRRPEIHVGPEVRDGSPSICFLLKQCSFNHLAYRRFEDGKYGKVTLTGNWQGMAGICPSGWLFGQDMAEKAVCDGKQRHKGRFSAGPAGI